MVNYQNSKIYELICSETNNIYIGSTTQKLCQRLGQHKRKDKNTCMSKTFINPKIYLLENTPCNSKEELHSIERKYIETTKCVNKCIPNRTSKEYYQDNKEKIVLKKKEYYQDNKETRKKYYQDNKETRNKYLLDNKEKISLQKKEYYQDNKETIKKNDKEWRQNNKEKKKEYSKLYYQNNKEKISLQKKEYYQDNKE